MLTHVDDCCQVRRIANASITLNGSAGQSLGAFLPAGITLRLFGDANAEFVVSIVDDFRDDGDVAGEGEVRLRVPNQAVLARSFPSFHPPPSPSRSLIFQPFPLLPAMQKSGANAFVAGNAIFNHPAGIAAGIQALQNCLTRPAQP